MCCASEWVGWGQLSDDGSGHYNPNRSEGPWGRTYSSHGGARAHCVPGLRTGMYVSQCSEGTKGRGKLSQGRKAPPDRPALKPYWRKFDVRNFRGDHGNIGIIEARLAPWSYPTSLRSDS